MNDTLLIATVDDQALDCVRFKSGLCERIRQNILNYFSGSLDVSNESEHCNECISPLKANDNCGYCLDFYKVNFKTVDEFEPIPLREYIKEEIIMNRLSILSIIDRVPQFVVNWINKQQNNGQNILILCLDSFAMREMVTVDPKLFESACTKTKESLAEIMKSVDKEAILSAHETNLREAFLGALLEGVPPDELREFFNEGEEIKFGFVFATDPREHGQLWLDIPIINEVFNEDNTDVEPLFAKDSLGNLKGGAR